MERVIAVALTGLMHIVAFAGQIDAADQKLPIVNGKEIVAMVDSEPITLDEFGSRLGEIEHTALDADAKTSVQEILNRLIDEKLFLLEARNIEIDKLPEVTRSIDQNARKTMAQLLVRQQVTNIEVDDAEVERQYKEEVKEYGITGAIFNMEDDARKVKEKLGTGASFDDIIGEVKAGHAAKEIMEGKYFKKQDLLPRVAEALSAMEIGSLSDVIVFEKGYFIVRLDGIQYPENPEAREKIRRTLWKIEKDKAIQKYIDSLVEKYAEVDQAALESINYETSAEGYSRFLEDRTVLAALKGGDPVTVGDLTAAFETKLYHGVGKRQTELNKRKGEMLNELLQQRVLVQEAKKQGIDRSDAYRDKIEQFRSSLVVGLFVEKIVTSKIKMTEEEVRSYYDEHRDDYTSPKMMKIDSIAFYTREYAESALASLRKGTDYKWLRANAAGRVLQGAPGILQFEGDILSFASLPEAVQTVLSDVSSEDYRLYEDDRHAHVVNVQKVFPPRTREYEEVRNEIARELYNTKVSDALKHWSDKLKEHYPVKVYLTDLE